MTESERSHALLPIADISTIREMLDSHNLTLRFPLTHCREETKNPKVNLAHRKDTQLRDRNPLLHQKLMAFRRQQQATKEEQESAQS